jgi:transcription elongation factor GreA
MTASIPMTPEGYAKLKTEANELEKRRPGIKEAIETAREKGDLRENADYHAAREELGMLNARVESIHGKLANAVVVDPSKAPEGKAVLGSTVTIKRVADGKELTRTLVGEGEADVASGKILTTSPVGKALISHEEGDVVTVELPKGPSEFEILSIS